MTEAEQFAREDELRERLIKALRELSREADARLTPTQADLVHCLIGLGLERIGVNVESCQTIH